MLTRRGSGLPGGEETQAGALNAHGVRGSEHMKSGYMAPAPLSTYQVMIEPSMAMMDLNATPCASNPSFGHACR